MEKVALPQSGDVVPPKRGVLGVVYSHPKDVNPNDDPNPADDDLENRWIKNISLL